MNPSAILDFLRSRAGLLAAGGFLLVIIVGLASALRSGDSVRRAVSYTNSPPPPLRPSNAPSSPWSPRLRRPRPPIRPWPNWRSLFRRSPTNPLGIHAPTGRLLRCQLVNTIDSSSIDTPIIALVAADLWHGGELVVPTGTEVHGRARLDRMRERIVASGAWTLVWQTGEELVVNGIALDREEDPSGLSWGLTDGSAGLRGQVLRSDVLTEVKLFLATFMSGMAAGLQQTQPTILGTEFPATARNAALTGASSVMNRYAEDLAETVRRDGLYIRVPAGKQMYLYLTETLDRARARAGNARRLPLSEPSLPTLKPSPHHHEEDPVHPLETRPRCRPGPGPGRLPQPPQDLRRTGGAPGTRAAAVHPPAQCLASR
ncbi:MAG: TrbI/VirB10 family protein [Verrucomicrobia bacterium]|nr:TrbI/VirB10 family protein [Verrucomicrobiota bacterium]